MIEVELPDGRVLEFPEGTDQATMKTAIDGLLAADTPQPAAPEQGMLARAGEIATDVAGGAASGLRKGATAIAGLPVDLVNMSPMLGNLLPGEQGMQPLSAEPVGGAQFLDELLRGGVSGVSEPVIPEYEPTTTAGRFADRIGQEVGATAVPLAGAGLKAAQVGVDGARRMAPAARRFVEPMAINPGQTAAREMGYAVAAGTGAQTANELTSEDGEGNFWSDVLGSIGGMAALGIGQTAGGVGRRMWGAANGDTSMMEDVAGEVVSSRILDNSTDVQSAYSRGGRDAVNPNDLARRLETPSEAERMFPGYQADIADRAQDPGIAVLSYNTNTVLPGAAAARRNANAGVVDEWFQGAAPQGNPSQLRADLEAGANQRIGDARANADGIRGADERMQQAVEPQMGPVDRGYSIRTGLAEREAAEKDAIANLYSQVDESIPVDAGGLRERMAGVTEGLPVNDRARFMPPEAGTAGQLDGEVPVREAMSIRSGLSSDIRSPSATDQQRRVTGQYLDEVDDFINQSLPEDQRAILGEAKNKRLDVGRRFEDRGAVPDILRKTGRDQYRMADEVVPGRATGSETDYRAVMSEAGQNPQARKAVADQILADAQRTGALKSPGALAKFTADKGFALNDFPEVRQSLERAGVSKKMLADAEAAAAKAEADFSPGGSSATGRYLKYDDTGTRDAMRTVWKSARPAEAAREVLDVAGGSPETRQAAKAALWEEVKASGKLKAATETGQDGVTRWSGRKLNELLEDPKFQSVADVLWEDDPAHLQNIREAARALAGADGSLRARAPSSSGTAQSLSNKMDPALSTASIASRVRSVNRGQLSPTIAVVDVLSTALRNRAGRVQAKAIDEMLAKAINEPEFAAALLRKHNPADQAAMKKAFLGKYGVRIPTVANALTGADDEEDDMMDRFGGDE